MVYDPRTASVYFRDEKLIPFVHETQRTISEWADVTFGDTCTNLSIATRANKEMAELLMCLANDDADPHAVEECADICIVLLRLVERHKRSLALEIEAKMGVNRKRTWTLDGHGHGYHVKEP